MFPVCDVIPSRRTPYVTLTLIVLYAAGLIVRPALGGTPGPAIPFLWLVAAATLLALWLFGENVEDRLGHFGFAALCAATAAAFGSAAAVSAVMGAYFVFYPQSRVLTAILLPFHFDLTEVPAVFFLATWGLLQALADVNAVTSHLAAFGCGGLAALAWRQFTSRQWQRY
jgi:rhomboid family protein